MANRGFEKELLRIRNAIALREKEIASEIEQASAPLLYTYHQQIEDAARTLNIRALLRPGPPESYLVDVENASALAVRKIAEQRTALDYVTQRRHGQQQGSVFSNLRYHR